METIVNSSEAGDAENSTTESGPTVVHVTVPSQSVQVQSVIQANQPSVIQATGGPAIQTIQVAPVSEVDGDEGEEESRKRREMLARRPSYRKILNDLSADAPTLTVTKVEEDSSSDIDSENDQATNLSTGGSAQFQTATVVPAHTIQIAADGTAQGLQTLTMTNVNTTTPSATPTIVQYAQGPDGQFLIPVSSLSGGSVQYQLATSNLSQGGVVMATTNSTIGSGNQVPEEASRKRELRLLKNREAARECRRKKKEYVKCLENRVAVLENQNKTLIEELKSLKELYCQKEAQS